MGGRQFAREADAEEAQRAGSRESVAQLAPLMMANLGVWRAILSTYMFVCIWMSVSMAVIMFNKWLLAFYGFPYPLTLTMWHMIFCSSIALVPTPHPPSAPHHSLLTISPCCSKSSMQLLAPD